jgi:hypothetical protein
MRKGKQGQARTRNNKEEQARTSKSKNKKRPTVLVGLM